MAKSKKESISGKLNFSIDSSLLFQLGEQLVAKPSIALSELVKNSYDADATHVVVSLEGIGKPGGTISIIDDGHGMSLEEIQNFWMRIATTAKRGREISKVYCRPLTGAKGIGRFAARRLGGKLTLLSIAALRDGEKEKVLATFDWKKKFLPGQDLVSVPVAYTRELVLSDTPTGVTLVIEDARDAWEEEEILELRRDLLSLQSPFPDLTIRSERANKEGCQDDPGFNFEIQISGSNELERLSGGLGDAFLRAAWAKLDGNIDEHGHAHYDIEFLRTGNRDSLIDDTNIYSGLEGARLRVYYFIYASEYFKDSDFNVRDASQKGREEGGIRIYLDGFRVFPYGSQSDDWLRLDEYAVRNVDMATAISPPERVLELANTISGRPFLLIPRNRQLFGVVAASQAKHSNIEINISRERLLETPTVALLRQFVQSGIYWMTLKYAAFLAEEKEKRRKEKAPKTVREFIGEAKSTLAAMQGIPEGQRIVLTL
ncbi:MAG: ATP-binding protein, partial [Anaerolineaceae bacterium]